MPLPIVGEIERGLFEPDSSTVSLFDAVKHVADCRPVGETLQFDREVLLEGLSFARSSALKLSMYVLWDVSDEHVRHAFIMLSHRRMRNAPSEHAPTVSLGPRGCAVRRVRNVPSDVYLMPNTPDPNSTDPLVRVKGPLPTTQPGDGRLRRHT